MIGLWDTTGAEVVKALAAERRSAGGVTSGLALTLIAVVDEKRVREAEAAATIAAAAHPCRLLIVVRSDVTRPVNRLDAEIVVGGRLGPCEAVVMRMYGRLALHAESVVMPLLALRQRAADYAPGDTDLAWTRITPWRTLVAGAFDTLEARVTGATVIAPEQDPTAALMRGWLAARLGVNPKAEPTTEYPRLRTVELTCANGDVLRLTREDGTATFSRTGQVDRTLPLVRRPLGDELAEELRRLDADQIYGEALGALAGLSGLEDRSPHRVHIWKDPAVSERPDAPAAPAPDGAAPAESHA
jgi:glucose-6-phosphate dehydrogenase assembly protein OpcA